MNPSMDTDQPPLPVLTASQINGAKKLELQFWVDEINKAVLGKPIKRSQNVPELRKAIAAFLGISLDDSLSTNASHEIADLSTPAPPPSVNAQIDHALRVKQYKGLFDLGLEWQKKVECGEEFLLLKDDDGK